MIKILSSIFRIRPCGICVLTFHNHFQFISHPCSQVVKLRFLRFECVELKLGIVKNAITMEKSIYHEKQVKEFCALHALNNLFQKEDAFLKSELDAVCYSLAPKVWFNPHKSSLGLGNYDVNILIVVLQNRGYQTIWFDKRKNPNCLRLSKIFGFIMNIPNDYHIGYIRFPLQRRHWIAIRKIGSCYYNLDSKLKEPNVIGQEADLISYFQQKLNHKDNQLFVVVPSDTHDWRIDSASMNVSLNEDL